MNSPGRSDRDETATSEADEPADGRVARRRRNMNSVLDVVLEMFGENAMFPTMEQAATRSGLSLRSLYRYFADPGELLEAAIRRSRERGLELSRLHAIGQGPLGPRIDDFVTMRVELYEAVGPVYRATVANAARHPRIHEEQRKNRDTLSEQFERQFGPELSAKKQAERKTALSAGDLLTQLGAIDYLRQHRQLSTAETRMVLSAALRAILE
ncbi:MAG: TetR/AcrR family transcriptional regulator [Acidimicrobiia bacterium]|nr:TetR/AcrR family transcriptional regulator [Acidimicrobiia bacterium]